MNIQFSGGNRSNRSSRTGQPLPPIAGILIGALFAIIGLVFGVSLALNGIQDQKIVDADAQTQGTVTDVYEKVSRSNSSSSTGSRSSSTKRTEHVVVSYIVPDKGNYTTKVSRSLKRSNGERTALNSSVTVYYDADKPNNSVVKGWEGSPFGGVIFGGIFFLVGSVIIVSSIRSARAKSSEPDSQ